MSTTCKKQFHKKLNHMDVTKNRSQHQIKNGDIILTYIGMLKVTMKSLNSITQQYHSEAKNDKDVERLLSGKFENNALVL